MKRKKTFDRKEVSTELCGFTSLHANTYCETCIVIIIIIISQVECLMIVEIRETRSCDKASRLSLVYYYYYEETKRHFAY